MSAPVALLTSAMTHNARILAGSPNRLINGVPVARLGDPVLCPKHNLNAIVAVNVVQLCDGKPVAHVGARAACGAEIITGSPNLLVG